MKTSKKITTGVFIAVLLLTVIAFALLAYTNQKHLCRENTFGNVLQDCILYSVMSAPLFLSEVSLYADTLYFLSEREKRTKTRTVCGIVGICLSVCTHAVYLLGRVAGDETWLLAVFWMGWFCLPFLTLIQIIIRWLCVSARKR